MKEDFLQYQAPTSLYPLGLEVARAEGSYIYDTQGKAYLDLVAGVSACTLGHCHPKVVKAIQEQAAKYMQWSMGSMPSLQQWSIASSWLKIFPSHWKLLIWSILVRRRLREVSSWLSVLQVALRLLPHARPIMGIHRGH